MHAAAVLRLTGSERAVAEIVAIAEHLASLSAAAAAFQLAPDVPEARDGMATVALPDATTAPDAAATLDAIAGWARGALGISHVPAAWRAFAHHPRLLEVLWRKNRLVLNAGVLDERTKGCAALAVDQFRQSGYWIAYQSQFLRVSCGFDDRALVELTGMTMHSLSFNTIAHGMRLEAPVDGLAVEDFEPGGRLEKLSGPWRPAPHATPSD